MLVLMTISRLGPTIYSSASGLCPNSYSSHSFNASFNLYLVLLTACKQSLRISHRSASSAILLELQLQVALVPVVVPPMSAQAVACHG